ncbi:MAG: hypothetical protein RRA94_07630, partial [Bacteroidota bacterium]|nr:hypothetical protein [Bacteroidota bacterium]
MLKHFTQYPHAGSRVAMAIPAILAFLLLPSLLVAQDNANCYMCHEDRELSGSLNGRTRSMFVDERIIKQSVHGEFECTICHLDVDPEDLPHAEDLDPVDCG